MKQIDKVWLAVSSTWDTYIVLGVFSTEEKAEGFINKPEIITENLGLELWVEEYTVDETD